jgi:hypothetical protein
MLSFLKKKKSFKCKSDEIIHVPRGRHTYGPEPEMVGAVPLNCLPSHDPIIVGNDVWIAPNVSIMQGVTVGNGTVIAQESFVTKDVPPHSPNLNLIERYWKFFKKKVLNNRYYKTFEEFKLACKSFVRKRKKYLPELQRLPTKYFHIQAA